MKDLIHQTEKFLTKMRWKALFFLKDDDSEQESNSEDEDEYHKRTFGFNTANSPPTIKEISSFESDIWDLVENIEFTDNKSHFQRKLDKDISSIKNLRTFLSRRTKRVISIKHHQKLTRSF